jgi:protein-S-isoprenylcysteine O-methyltransferase Ste14
VVSDVVDQCAIVPQSLWPKKPLRGVELKLSKRLLDLSEQFLLLAALIWFFTRIWPAAEDFGTLYDSLYAVLIVISEGAVILFVVSRAPTDDISIRFWDWLIAILATIGPLFVNASEWLIEVGAIPELPIVIRNTYTVQYELGLALLFIGMFIHIGAKLSLNRSFGIVAANRGVRQNGLYRFVRHPMYFGYVVAHTGFFLTSASIWNALVYGFVWSLFVARIFAEERVLSEDAAYRAFKEKTRYRLVPGIF